MMAEEKGPRCARGLSFAQVQSIAFYVFSEGRVMRSPPSFSQSELPCWKEMSSIVILLISAGRKPRE